MYFDFSMIFCCCWYSGYAWPLYHPCVRRLKKWMLDYVELGQRKLKLEVKHTPTTYYIIILKHMLSCEYQSIKFQSKHVKSVVRFVLIQMFVHALVLYLFMYVHMCDLNTYFCYDFHWERQGFTFLLWAQKKKIVYVE